MTVQRLDRAPTFFILGMARSGTTALHAALRRHPAIYLTEPKEPEFFSTDARYAKGLGHYLDTYFRGAAGYPARGEATVSHFHLWDRVIPRLQASFPGAPPRFVVVFREPVGRVWSWHHQRRFDAPRLPSLDRMLDREPVADPARMRPGLLRANLAAANLRPWLDAFGASNVHVLLTEDLSGPASATAMRGLLAFLGVDPHVPLGEVRRTHAAKRLRWPRLASLVRTSTWQRLPLDVDVRRRIHEGLLRGLWQDDPDPPRCPPALAERIRAFYADDTRELERLIGRDVSHWLPRAEVPTPGA